MGVLADLTKAEIERIEQAKADIAAALKAKGLSVSSKNKIDTYAEQIESAVISKISTVTLNNNLQTEGKTPGTVMVFYTKKDTSSGVVQLVPSASITVEALQGSVMVAMPYGTVESLHAQYLNGYAFYPQAHNGTATLISSELMSAFYATDETGEYSASWA